MTCPKNVKICRFGRTVLGPLRGEEQGQPARDAEVAEGLEREEVPGEQGPVLCRGGENEAFPPALYSSTRPRLHL